ncbi:MULTISPECIES: hypothetical protein [unclassified Microcoleus]|uniref:hypothetical protein n=1 Tax=unclassified Microcoleus TaxID=2642155 RepID=UPI002FD0764B
MVDAISAIVREEKLRGDRSLLMLKLTAVTKSDATGYFGWFEFLLRGKYVNKCDRHWHAGCQYA